MKVLIQTRPGLGGILTGDVTQVRKTAEALEALGVTVRYSDLLEPDPGDADVVHLFSTLQPYYTYLRLRHLKALGVPVVVSTIYWAWEPAEQRMENILRLGWTRYQVSRAVNALRPHLPDRLRYRLQQTDLPFDIQARFYDLERRMNTDAMRRYIYDTADVLLPNSHIEYDYLQQHFGTRNDYVAVPNAVDPIFATGDADAFARKFGLRDFVLCCAAVQARKNQLRLIQAADALGLPLVLIGRRRRAMRRAAARPRRTGCISWDSSKARICETPTRRHGPMRSSVSTRRRGWPAWRRPSPTTRSSRRTVARPVNISAIRPSTAIPWTCPRSRAALSRAWEAKPDPALKARILRDYNWRKTAEATLEGYRRAIEKAAKPVPAA